MKNTVTEIPLPTTLRGMTLKTPVLGEVSVSQRDLVTWYYGSQWGKVIM